MRNGYQIVCMHLPSLLVLDLLVLVGCNLSVQLENKIIVCIYLNVQIHDTPVVKIFRVNDFEVASCIASTDCNRAP